MLRHCVIALALLATAAAAAPRREAATAPGLAAPGEIVVDRWGIAHIYAGSSRDAFFLQGYAVARDRLWQIDLWRKRGLGRLAASFGPAFVAQDRASRLFLYRGDMAAEWAAYPAEAKGWTQAFAAGINAYVGDVAAGRRPLPEEFRATGSTPERWQADDVVRIRSNALASNLPSELARARSLCAGGLPYEPLRRKLEPPHAITLPKGLDPCVLTPEVLGDYALGTAGVRFEAGKLVAQTPAERLAAAADPEVREGSNNWVIAPARSATGRAILANDPHREHSVPSLRTLVHLEAPDLHIAGAGEPALPGVSFGHNEDAAWALTIFYIDQQDLVVAGAETPFRDVVETIDVRGEAPRQVTLQFTPDGPVIHRDAAGRAFVLRATWDRPGASAYFNAAWLFRAKSWADFKVAQSHWGAPPLNLLYADRSGDIGWGAAGFAPVRASGDGLLPVPAGADYRWEGLLDPGLLPRLHNPARGWIATANEMNLPGDYPAEARPLGFEWADRSRIGRIETVIGAKPKFSLADAMALQTDTHSPLAARAVALLKGLNGEDADQQAALRLLGGWDGNMSADSAAAALYEVWAGRHLGDAAMRLAVPAAVRPGMDGPSIPALFGLMERRDPIVEPHRAAILKASLGAAWRATAARLGPDPARWRWDQLHKAIFTPALAIPGREAQRQVGPAGVGGSGSTPMATSPRADFTVAGGASVRMVLDVGDWDASMVINAPGQSGDADSPHYRDLFPMWAAGRYVPFRWTRTAVMRDAELVIAVTPNP
ncbi:MAG: penicillin acylase family protein [Alphaproteobacteria bacterium]|nr:MAG: penicillin acylase family protein [Alphaproteobacteria bacterium]